MNDDSYTSLLLDNSCIYPSHVLQLPHKHASNRYTGTVRETSGTFRLRSVTAHWKPLIGWRSCSIQTGVSPSSLRPAAGFSRTFTIFFTTNPNPIQNFTMSVHFGKKAADVTGTGCQHMHSPNGRTWIPRALAR